MKIAVLPGDGIGPEVTREAVRVIEALGLPDAEMKEAPVGGAAGRPMAIHFRPGLWRSPAFRMASCSAR